MVTKKMIDDFLAPKKLVMAGVSRNPKKFGYTAFKHLIDNGYEVIPINPNTSEIEQIKCYPDVKSVPGEIENLFIVTPKSQTSEIVNQAKEKGVKRIWIQQMAESKDALEIAKNAGIETISNKCIFMFAEPVTGPHKFHRFFVKLFGNYPKN